MYSYAATLLIFLKWDVSQIMKKFAHYLPKNLTKIKRDLGKIV